MVNPNLQRRKQNSSLVISEDIEKLFRVIYREQSQDKSTGGEEPKIVVSELISKMAFYYEKIRNSVDYQEDYLLRKGAIERILKRQLIIESVVKVSKSEQIASHLLHELIRAGYLPNNKIPERKIGEIASIVEKHILLRNYVIPNFGASLEKLKTSFSTRKAKKKYKQNINERNKLSNWLLTLMSSEIEENLGLDPVREVVVNNMYKSLTENIKLPQDIPLQQDFKIQIYLGIHRNYLKFDEGMLSFIIFKYYNKNWEKPSEADIKEIAENMNFLSKAIKRQLEHPLKKQLDKIINRYTVYYTILTETIIQKPQEFYREAKNDPKSFYKSIENTFNRKYNQAKSKLWRAAFRSIIYIFLTKSLIALIFEVPVSQWLGQGIDYFALSVNISFPALLLFLAVVTTRVSSEENNKKIITGVGETVFQEKEKQNPILLRNPTQFGKGLGIFFKMMYSVTFFVSFGFVVWVLDKLSFNWISIIIFLFFLTFASFFAIRIRKIVRQYIVVERRENIFSFFLDFFYIPIAVVGKWLSERFSRINVFIFILDFIIEAPFKVFVEIAEQWTRYVEERKEDLK